MSDINPEIVAGIAASSKCVMEDTNVSAELLAAITAAVVHHSGKTRALRIERTNSAWGLVGRQKLMDVRQFG